MREKRTFATRTKILSSDEAKKKYFLVYEGQDTERIYFEELNDKRDALGVNPLIELVPILRSYSEINWSNPKKILERVLQNLEEAANSVVTVETLLNWIMEYFYDEKILTTSKVEAKNMWERLKHICSYYLNLELNDYVSDTESCCTEIGVHFLEETKLENIVKNVSEIIQERAITYAEGLDKICFIIDRDRNSFISSPENNQYDYVLKTCEEKGFGFYLSNPCFEFWLLLHFDEVKQLDNHKLLDNSKATADRRYVENELRKLLPGYTKSRYAAKDLLTRIDIAIKNEHDYCEDTHLLENSLGSRVGLLIEELRR